MIGEDGVQVNWTLDFTTVLGIFQKVEAILPNPKGFENL
jgi:hypothetical protein